MSRKKGNLGALRRAAWAAALMSVVTLVLMPVLPAWSGDSAADAAPGTIGVSTSREFLAALGSDRTIVLAPGEYVLTEWDPFYAAKASEERKTAYPHLEKEGAVGLEDGVSWSGDVYDGGEVLLRGISNLTVRGEGDARIVVDPRYAYVLSFEDCRGIVMENVTAGHSDGGYCMGGVFLFKNSSQIVLNGVGMYGCGTEGLTLRNVSGMTVTNSSIYECTDSIMTVSGSGGIVFTDCRFYDNGEYSLVNVADTGGLSFTGCRFTGNRGTMFSVEGHPVSVTDSVFSGNRLDGPLRDSLNVLFTGCSFD